MARINKSKAAYFLVDLTLLSAEDAKLIIEDAAMGGGEFGVRVVEEVHNGPASQPIYGVYYDVVPGTGDETKWNAAKAEFGISVDELGVEKTEEEQLAEMEAEEARLRAAAASDAEAEAERVRAAEEAELEAVTKQNASANKNKHVR